MPLRLVSPMSLLAKRWQAPGVIKRKQKNELQQTK
jgi:hypothetical protein